MAARVQIVVEAKDAASGILRGITSQLGGVGKMVEDLTGKNVAWGNLAATAAGMVIDGLKDAVKVTQAYAKEVRDLSAISGVSAQEASRLIQVLDDFEISAQDVTAATRIMTRQGLAPTVETLAQLSDQYLSLNTVQEKNEFILKNLGRGGLQWVNVLKQGSGAIRDLSAGVNENLILTEENIRRTEEYRLAIDEFNDNMQGVKTTVGLSTIEFVNNAMAMERMRDMAREMGAVGFDEANRFAAAILVMKDHIDSATVSYTAWAESLKKSSVAADGVERDFKDMISLTQKLQGATADARKKITFDMLLMKLSVDGLTEAEYDLAVSAGEALGIFDEKTADAARNINFLTDQVVDGTRSIESLTSAIFDIPPVTTATINIVTNGSIPNVSNVSTTSAGVPSSDTSHNQQTGGTVYAGNPYLVGERGAEPFFPRSDGRILGHAESLHALTLGGGGGGTNYFYGNVTLQIGEDAGQGLMSIR